jgi:hypothetical protein
MPYVSILAAPGDEYLRITGSPEPVTVPQPLTPLGTFGDRPLIVVFQREVPDPAPVLDRLRTALASSRVENERDAYSCPAPLAIRAVEIAVAALWPPNRLRCGECKHYFVAPIADARRMYVACPHCHNPMLNPRWSSA